MTTRARAAVLVALGEPLRIVDLDVPSPGAGQVLVRITHSGVCHTQLSEARGRRGPDVYLPHCLGHEAAGLVEAVGESVTTVAPGDEVVITWLRGTGAPSGPISYGSSDLGTVNSGPVSTFLTEAVVAEDRVLRVPPGIPGPVRALLGCAVPTGGGAVRNIASAKSGESIAVFGVGGVGLSAILAAVDIGLSPIIAVDIDRAKLDFALGLGATDAIDATVVDAAAAVLELTGGFGVDVAIEATSAPVAMEQAFRSVTTMGGRAVICGNLHHGGRISIDPFDLIRGRRILGSWGGGTDPDVDIPEYARLWLEGGLSVEKLISSVYALDDINAALDDLEHGRVARAIVDMSAD